LGLALVFLQCSHNLTREYYTTFVLAGGVVEAGSTLALVALPLAEAALVAGEAAAVEGGQEVRAEAAIPTRARLALVHLSLAPEQRAI